MTLRVAKEKEEASEDRRIDGQNRGNAKPEGDKNSSGSGKSKGSNTQGI